MYSRIKCWASGRTVKLRINMIHQKVSKKLNNVSFLKQRFRVNCHIKNGKDILKILG